jgi:hypothetical protein
MVDPSERLRRAKYAAADPRSSLSSSIGNGLLAYLGAEGLYRQVEHFGADLRIR